MPLLQKRIIFSLYGLVLIAIILFSCFYLICGYKEIVSWYFSLNNCFYESEHFTSTFFTQKIKHEGNIYCIVSIIVSTSGLAFLWYKLKHSTPLYSISLQVLIKALINKNKYDYIPLLLCIISGGISCYWGNRLALPAYDEVFSAQNFAEMHPFQTISYYKLPNNHLFYNLLNNILFHFFKDKVITGRLISFFAYEAFIVILFLWLRDILKNGWLACLATITLSLQFFIWGFSFQARGYELYLVAEWGMIISFFCFLLLPIKTTKKVHNNWLLLNIFCCIIGYFIMPSFLYIHIAQLVFMVFYCVVFNKNYVLFWKYQLIAILAVFLCYLPVLCFSGIEAITQNQYVSPVKSCKDLTSFFYFVFPYFSPFIKHIYSDIEWKGVSISLVLFFFPLILLFVKNIKLRLYGLFYLTLWLVFFIIVFAMKRLPFERNLVGHYSFTLLGLILVVHHFSSEALKYNKTKIVFWITFPTCMMLLSLYFIKTNESLLTERLYEYNVNQTYKDVATGLKFIPANNTVAFSTDGFLCYYLCKKNGAKVSKCNTGNEDYFVRFKGDELPTYIVNKSGLQVYKLIKTFNEYEVYKKEE